MSKLKIGRKHAGGIIFWLNEDGTKGLVISKPLSKFIGWSKEYSVTNAQSNNNGAANTKIIITARPNPNDDANNNAAWLCYEYRGGGYKDWYLPSKNELDKLYESKLIRNGCYWSSTEYADGSEGYAWYQDFSGGGQSGLSSKGNHFGVRAIRAFNLKFSAIDKICAKEEVHSVIYRALIASRLDEESVGRLILDIIDKKIPHLFIKY